MHDVIINTAEAHHFDCELLYPETWVVTAADMISASRPGARVDSKEKFIERMSNLETLVSTIPGVSKAYIMQAGREIMAFYSPTDVRDEDVESLTVDIAKKIEDQLDYPGSIRIVGIREQRVTQYLR
jgi:ribonucrease Y